MKGVDEAILFFHLNTHVRAGTGKKFFLNVYGIYNNYTVFNKTQELKATILVLLKACLLGLINLATSQALHLISCLVCI